MRRTYVCDTIRASTPPRSLNMSAIALLFTEGWANATRANHWSCNKFPLFALVVRSNCASASLRFLTCHRNWFVNRWRSSCSFQERRRLSPG